eukprot:TRINITY_DN22069_c0_g1_i1.p1 TRINITY_DN22069_c0_g1~~TRINITY_DN22069_c0_g1_i1.p1  ORF type:complete len:163 (-),score=42.76 TRINITY_DN22069_c0_g1_i1:4-492(-)
MQYRAPEVFMEDECIGEEIDMWSLGCVLYEIFTGDSVFKINPKETLLDPEKLEEMMCEKIVSYIGDDDDDSDDDSDDDNNSAEQATARLLRFLQAMLRDFEFASESDLEKQVFASFIAGLLTRNPKKRLTPLQAFLHPFMANEWSRIKALQHNDGLLFHRLG